MIPKVIVKERQRARRDVNNDDYDESTDSLKPVTSARDAGISRMEPDEVVWISGGGSPRRTAPADVMDERCSSYVDFAVRDDE